MHDTIPPYDTIQYRFQYAISMLEQIYPLIHTTPEYQEVLYHDRLFRNAVFQNTVTEDMLEHYIQVIFGAVRIADDIKQIKGGLPDHSYEEGDTLAVKLDK